jgi:hypothetical protein
VGSAFSAALALFTFSFISFRLYTRLITLAGQPQFSLLSVPGYLALYCRRHSSQLDEQCRRQVGQLWYSERALIATTFLFLLLLVFVH